MPNPIKSTVCQQSVLHRQTEWWASSKMASFSTPMQGYKPASWLEFFWICSIPQVRHATVATWIGSHTPASRTYQRSVSICKSVCLHREPRGFESGPKVNTDPSSSSGATKRSKSGNGDLKWIGGDHRRDRRHDATHLSSLALGGAVDKASSSSS